LFKCKNREVLIHGPSGTGKSRACLEKAHHVALANPGCRILFVRKTATSLTSSVLDSFRKFIADGDPNLTFFGGSAQFPAQFQYSNGSVIVLGGMDKSDKVMSSEYDLIYVNEANELTITDWEKLTTRLRNWRVTFQQIIADCNPQEPTHWLKERCNSGATTELVSRHEENPRLYNADGSLTPEGVPYMATLDAMTGVRKERYRYGRWVAAEGIIYEEFDASRHVIDRFDIPMEWSRFWSVDFGTVHPFVCQMWAEDPDGKLYLYREFQRTKRTSDEHAADILREVTRDGEWIEPRPTRIVVDPADAGQRLVLSRALGMVLTSAKKDILPGIDAVQKRLRDDRLFFLRDSLVHRDQQLVMEKAPTCAVEEIVGYVWNTGGGRKVKEAPVQEFDDAMDAMRYLVVDRDLRASNRVRFA
jgi:PBSX family phage terminase large subunit